VVRLLRELIALPSVNPAFLPADDPLAGEHRVADFVASLGAKAGLSVDFQEVAPGRRNVLLRLTPPGRIRHRILLAPHLDTVGSVDGSLEIFQPTLANGRVWGRGACDTKGCVAAMLTALFDVAAAGSRPAQTEIVFAGLIDEENQQLGSRALSRTRLKADLGIVGEPTRLEVVTAHKGDVWARIETRGKAAHGARPDLGVNAVRAMARVVELMEDDYAAELARRPKHPLLGGPTINVGMIRGGSQPNIVPDRCIIEIDRRTVPGETAAGTKREIETFLRKHGVKSTLVDMKGVIAPPLETDPNLPWVQNFLAATGRRETHGVTYFCDAAILALGGIPCVVFGPGDIAQAHTAREWISITSLQRGTALLKRFLERLP
jgi:acetylornithine deacetylase/succinyl-diaminopimelate desuccinylase-like protein